MIIPSGTGKNTHGGMNMSAQLYWQLFLKTGSPEMYVLYKRAMQTEDVNVLDGQGIDIAGNQLQ
jgi:hypothetical protein